MNIIILYILKFKTSLKIRRTSICIIQMFLIKLKGLYKDTYNKNYYSKIFKSVCMASLKYKYMVFLTERQLYQIKTSSL